MVQGFGIGIKGILRSFDAVIKYGLLGHIALTILLSALTAYLVFYGIWNYSDDLNQLIVSWVPWIGETPWIGKFSEWIIWSTLMLLAIFCFKYLVMIVSSPIFSLMSEKIEAIYTGNPTPKLSISESISNLLRGMQIAIGNLSRELIYTVLLILLGFVPLLGLLSAPLILIIQAYYAGFGNMDYFLERHLDVKGSRRHVRRNAGIALSNGGFFLLLLMIPFVGLIIGPTITAIGATLSLLEKSENM